MKKKPLVIAGIFAAVAAAIVLLFFISKLASKFKSDSGPDQLITAENSTSSKKEKKQSATPIPTEKPLTLNSPLGLTASYNEPQGNLCLSWNKVENATSYEITDNGQSYTSLQPNYTISYPEEGMTHQIAVRAIAKDKNMNMVYSEYSNLSYNIPSMLQPVLKYYNSLHGSYIDIFWNQAEGATSYEFKNGSTGQVLEVPDPYWRLYDCTDGLEFNMYIRSKRQKGEHTYYSEWNYIPIKFATPDYQTDIYEYALDYDLERLKKWAKNKGYTIDISNSDGLVVADVHYKDTTQTALDSFIRGLESAASGYIGGATDSINEAIDHDFSDPFSAISALINSNGVKNYVTDLSDEADEAGITGAFSSFFGNIITNKDIHYIYYYSDINDSADLGCMTMLNDNHTTFFKDRYKNFTPDSDGLYTFITSYSNQIAVSTGTYTENGIKYNCSYFCHY